MLRSIILTSATSQRFTVFGEPPERTAPQTHVRLPQEFLAKLEGIRCVLRVCCEGGTAFIVAEQYFGRTDVPNMAEYKSSQHSGHRKSIQLTRRNPCQIPGRQKAVINSIEGILRAA